ncbi:Rhodanese domain protein [Pseudodesulfovibrio mercurii]|uniref:Rhodanese domain protein n=1 Tax=Pseudodesulfovibrio mercurii TaxID=641491 RepID=F0JBP1_9BACT|nr:rhodanese-like domain-containing protein [Pseudodesulfovibrio mercurii]EGB15544.1 Rhodanese domain protein [Pseudodesulfovibrio mercurii]
MLISRTGLAIAILCLALSATPGYAAERPSEEKKQTVLDLYVTPSEAYAQWEADKDNVHIVDCRTPEEYALIGHAPMAVNIPVMFMTCIFNPKTRSYVMQPNAEFEEMVKARFGTGDIIMIMCRSGSRSALAVNRLAKAGFTRAYSILDGFEGIPDHTPDSPNNGRRLVNGWANSRLPVTFAMRKSLMYNQESGLCCPR